MSDVKKSRYWTAVLYPESMSEDWQSICESRLQIPFEFCVHDKDKIELSGEEEDRKVHVHFFLAFKNTTTLKHALSVVQRLSPSTKYIEEVIDPEWIHNYLIHDTKECKEKKKYLYGRDERIACNNFDIGEYIQQSKGDKQAFKRELLNMIKLKKFEEFYQLMDYVYENYSASEIEVFDSYSSQLNWYVKSLRHSGVFHNGETPTSYPCDLGDKGWIDADGCFHPKNK